MAARSLNKAIIIGNLTREPELRYTAKGTPVCSFGVATNREWSPADSNEVRESTEFHNIVAWSKLAELCSQLLYKGRKVYIEGRLRTRNWDDKETGKRMYRTEIVAERMIALGAPKGVAGVEAVEEKKEKVERVEKEEKVGEKEMKPAEKVEEKEAVEEKEMKEKARAKGGSKKKAEKEDLPF